VSACGDNGGAAGGGGADADVGGAGEEDGASHDPPNPNGLGPAPLDLGTPGDRAAPGSYVLLAKTGVTNVTGSPITGGDVGLSPAAASFITGFALVASSTRYSTSASVVAPAKVYASNYAPPTPSNLTTAVPGLQAAYTDG